MSTLSHQTPSHQTYPFTPGAEDRIDLLLIDADPSDVRMVEKMLAESGMDAGITVASELAAARRSLTRRTQCILVDLSTAAPTGWTACARCWRCPGLPPSSS